MSFSDKFQPKIKIIPDFANRGKIIWFLKIFQFVIKIKLESGP